LPKIRSSCCCFGSAKLNTGKSVRIEEVHIALGSCPIQRLYGQREEDVTCVYRGPDGLIVAPCQFYGGTRKNQKKEYMVTCNWPDAVKEMINHAKD
jgi:hypothetical protein